MVISSKASSDKKQLDVGANLFIGNLDENVDERLLYDTFSAFGMMATTAKVCIPVSGISFTHLTLIHVRFSRRLRAIRPPENPKATVSSLSPISSPRTPQSSP